MYFVSEKENCSQIVSSGAGATVALPLLDAMMPAFAQSAARTVRDWYVLKKFTDYPDATKWGSAIPVRTVNRRTRL